MSSSKTTLRDISPIPFLASMALTFAMSHSPAAPPAGSTSDNAAVARPVTAPTVPPPTTPNINAIPSTTTGTPNSVSQPMSGATTYNAQRNLGTRGDTTLTQQVRTSLNGGQVSPESARGIQVQTVNGVVTLSGTVSSQAEADRAAAAARSASGKDVTNNITVQQK